MIAVFSAATSAARSGAAAARDAGWRSVGRLTGQARGAASPKRLRSRSSCTCRRRFLPRERHDVALVTALSSWRRRARVRGHGEKTRPGRRWTRARSRVAARPSRSRRRPAHDAAELLPDLRRSRLSGRGRRWRVPRSGPAKLFRGTAAATAVVKDLEEWANEPVLRERSGDTHRHRRAAGPPVIERRTARRDGVHRRAGCSSGWRRTRRGRWQADRPAHRGRSRQAMYR